VHGFWWSALLALWTLLTVAGSAAAQDVLAVPLEVDSVSAIQSAAERIVSEYVAVIYAVAGESSYVPAIEIVHLTESRVLQSPNRTDCPPALAFSGGVLTRFLCEPQRKRSTGRGAVHDTV